MEHFYKKTTTLDWYFNVIIHSRFAQSNRSFTLCMCMCLYVMNAV